MIRTLLLGASSALLSATAFAQLPEPLERALSVELIDATPSQVEMRIGTSEGRITVRMVEDAEGNSDYTLLAPPEDRLDEVQLELWQELLEDDEEEEGSEPSGEGVEPEEDEGFASESFDPAELRAMIGETATLDREEAGVLVYTFEPQMMPDEDPEEERDPAAEKMLENLLGEVHVNTETGHVQSVRLNLIESFKPNFAARIEGFEMVQDYVFDEAVNGPRLEGLQFSIAGSAAFQSFNESMLIDILSVDWAEPSAAPAALGAAAESH